MLRQAEPRIVISPVTAANIACHRDPDSQLLYTRETGLRPIERQLLLHFMPPPPASILDLGCGAGRTSAGLLQLGYRVTAIDLSESLLAVARERHPHGDFRQMDATNLEFADEVF